MAFQYKQLLRVVLACFWQEYLIRKVRKEVVWVAINVKNTEQNISNNYATCKFMSVFGACVNYFVSIHQL
jgi:hypothetical protein